MQRSFELRAGACAWALVVSLCTACDDDGGFSSGVAANKPLSELSAVELQQICDAASDYRSAALPEELQVRAYCTQEADALQGAACEKAVMSCVEQFADAGTALPAQLNAQVRFNCYSENEVGACEATVGELESCIGATFSLQARALHQIRCESEESVTPVTSAPRTSTVCEALNQKCSGLGNVAGRITSQPRPVDPVPTTDAGTGMDSSVPPPPSNCRELELAYDGSNCASGGSCSAVQCPCQPFSRSFTACNSIQGCLSAVDCAAACAATSVSFTLSCAQATTCMGDADCGDFHCAISSGSVGVCTRGQGGDPCDDNTDCQSGTCSLDSPRLCTGNTPAGSTCTKDVQCASGICYQTSSFSQGTCSNGATGDRCANASDCTSSICSYVSGTGYYMCSDGQTGSTCQNDTDCVSSRCAYGGRGSATCSDGESGSPCDDSSDCETLSCRTSDSSSLRTCAYTPGTTCPDGIADCNGDCRPAQAACSGGSCTPTCGSGACDAVTLSVWNASDRQTDVTLSNNDLTATTSTGTNNAVRGTLSKSSGSWYWELTLVAHGVSGVEPGIGVTEMTASLEEGLGNSSVSGVGLLADGTLRGSGISQDTVCGYGVGDVIGVALDIDNARIYFSVNGVWQGGANPVDGVNGTATDLSSVAVFPIINLNDDDVFTANFGQSAFAYTPPSGFSALYQ